MDFIRFLIQWFQPDLDRTLQSFSKLNSKLETVISHHTKRAQQLQQMALRASATSNAFSDRAKRAQTIKNNIKKLIEEN